MRIEFHDNGTRLAALEWEGPGQVEVEAEDGAWRARFLRFLGEEEVYLSAGAASGLESRRRDWTPWEFERACRAFGARMGYRVERVPSSAVERRPDGAGSRT
ncbi:MAG: hypothetical protein HY658_01500 [Actinobacteria bacterium]|nr:hypothetical protein [Actinomycetota bacterium]